MKPKQNENMEYGLRSPLLEVVEGYGDGRRENLRRRLNGHLHCRLLTICQFSSYGIFMLAKTQSDIIMAGK